MTEAGVRAFWADFAGAIVSHGLLSRTGFGAREFVVIVPLVFGRGCRVTARTAASRGLLTVVVGGRAWRGYPRPVEVEALGRDSGQRGRAIPGIGMVLDLRSLPQEISCGEGLRGFESHPPHHRTADHSLLRGFQHLTPRGSRACFLSCGWRGLAGRGLFLTCFSVLGLDWGFLGLGRSPGKALEYWLGGVVSESGLILGDFPGPCL